MYTFVNQQLGKDAKKVLASKMIPTKGKISGNSIDFDDDCSSYLYYSNTSGRDMDLVELNKMLKLKV